jgi:hypothetical protein
MILGNKRRGRASAANLRMRLVKDHIKADVSKSYCFPAQEETYQAETARPQIETVSRFPSCRCTAALAFSSAALYAAWRDEVSG